MGLVVGLGSAAGCTSAMAAAVTQHWGAELRIDERMDNGRRQVYGGEAADGSTTFTLTVPNALPDYYVNDPKPHSMTLWPVAQASLAPSLKTQALINYDLDLGWVTARGRAWSEARLDDLLQVRFDPAVPASNMVLRFEMHVDGRFWAEIENGSNLAPLDLVSYQYYLSAWLSAQWKKSSDLAGTQQDLFENQMHRLEGAVGDFGLFQQLIPFADDPYGGSSRLTWFSPELITEAHFLRNQTYVLDIPIEPGENIDFSLAMVSGAALTLENVDFFGIDGQIDAGFAHTVEIAAVRLLDVSGRDYAGLWTLDSALGIAYPAVSGGDGGTVSEPAPAGLLMAALAAMALCRRRITARVPALMLAASLAGLGTSVHAGPAAFWQLGYEYENLLGGSFSTEETYRDTRSGDSNQKGTLHDTVRVDNAWGYVSGDFTATIPPFANIGLLQAGARISGVIGGAEPCLHPQFYCPPGMTTPWTAARVRSYAAARISDRLRLQGPGANIRGDLVFTWTLDGSLHHLFISDPPSQPVTGLGTPLNLIGINTWAAGDLFMRYRPEGGDSVFQRIDRGSLWVSDLVSIFETEPGFSPEQTQGLEFLPDATLPFGVPDFIWSAHFDHNREARTLTVSVPFQPGTDVDVEFTMAAIAAMTATNIDHPGLIWEVESDFQSTARLLSVDFIDSATGRAFDGDWSLLSAEGYLYPLRQLDGEHSVPMPAPWLLLAAALLAGGLQRFTRRRV